MKENIHQEGEFSYLEKGEGHTIIILHGLFGALSNFEGVIDQFSKNYHVVAPIMPIYDLPIIKTNVTNLAKFIRKFIEFKKLTNYTLLGNSLGGHVALAYTKEYQKEVHSLVLTGSSGLYENAFGGGYPRKDDKTYLRKKIEVTFYDPKMTTDELVDECYQVVNDRAKLIRILAIAKSAIRHNMREDLKDFTLPTCLIWGKNDEITPPEVAEEFHEKMPNSTLSWIDKCGHAPMMEHPETFNTILDKWFEKTFDFKFSK